MSKSHRRILLSIPTDAVGLLIGKEGKTFNEISVQSNAKLTLQLHHDICRGSRERYIAIEGEIDKIGRACRIIIEKLSGRNAAKGGDDQIELIKWVISQTRCSMIIGRNGSGIKAINAASGAWVKIAHVEEACPGDSQRLLYIRGTKAQNDIALAMVKQIAGGHPLEPTTDLPKTVMEAVATSNAMEFTLPGFLIREVLTGIDDVDIQIDPEFDVYMGKEVKVKLLGRKTTNLLPIKQMILNNADAIKDDISSYRDDGKILDDIFAREPFMALKILTTLDDNTLLSNAPNRDGIVVRDLLFRLFGVAVMNLPSSVKYSQAVDYRQLVVVAPQITFMTKLEEILVHLTTEQDYSQVSSIRRPPLRPQPIPNSSMPYVNRYDQTNYMQDKRRGTEYEGHTQYVYQSHNIPVQSTIQQVQIPHPQPMQSYTFYPTSPQMSGQSPPSYGMTHYTLPQSIPPNQYMGYHESYGENGNFLSMSPPSPPISRNFSGSSLSGYGSQLGYDIHNSPIHGAKQSPLMNISYVSANGSGMGMQSFGLDTAQVLPILNNGNYAYLPPPMPLSPQMSGSFFTGEYGIVYSPPSSPTRTRKKSMSRGHRHDPRTDLRSRSSSADSMSASLDNFYQNLTSESLDQHDSPPTVSTISSHTLNSETTKLSIPIQMSKADVHGA